MLTERIQLVSRGSLAALVLLSGLVILPFTNLSANQIDWRAFAGVYQPVLSVNYEDGAPGSIFLFSASGYPPNSLATVYINGEVNSQIMMGADGSADFVIRTSILQPPGEYLVVVAVGDVSAIESFELVAAGATRPFPEGHTGPALTLGGINHLPTLHKR